MRETNTHIYFWGSNLSNWIPDNLNIKYDNYHFKTSEQLFMYLKAMYFNDVDTAIKIVNYGDNPKTAKQLGREVKRFNESEWLKEREHAMYVACYEKFAQYKHLKKYLLDTEDKILVEASPVDKIWGIGLKYDNDSVLDENKWLGLNLLGKVLMKVRNDIK